MYKLKLISSDQCDAANDQNYEYVHPYLRIRYHVSPHGNNPLVIYSPH